MGEDNRNVLLLIARRLDLLTALYPNQEYYLGQLAEKTGENLGNISKYVANLEKMNLVSIREARERKRGRENKYVKLTGGCRGILDACDTFYRLQKPEEFKLSDADTEEVDFLLQRIKKPPSDDAREQAIWDLKELCRRSSIWKIEFPSDSALKKNRFWSFINQLLRGGSDEPEKALSFLITIAGNASAAGEEEVVKGIYNLFAPRIKGLAESPTSSRDLRFNAVWVLDSMSLPNNEKWDVFTHLLEKSMRKEDDKTYYGLIQMLFGKFKDLRKWDEKKYRDWFYELMSDNDPKVRKRASSFYATLRST